MANCLEAKVVDGRVSTQQEPWAQVAFSHRKISWVQNKIRTALR